MKVLILETFMTGSHKLWVEGYGANSKLDVEVLSLPGHFWKWRMHGGAITLAEYYMQLPCDPDVIIASDMVDLTTFQSLTRKRTAKIPFITYFHENQITYPWSRADKDVQLKRDHHYGFINFTTALASDEIWFNSQFHMNAFFPALENFLRKFPDYRQSSSIEALRKKSAVHYLGLDIKMLQNGLQNKNKETRNCPVILWNHRWENDKNPELFFETLFRLKNENVSFKLVVLGESFNDVPSIFTEAKQKLESHIVHWGFCESRTEYIKWIKQCDLIPVTSFQDNFGVSIMEAVCTGVLPILPNRLSYPELYKEIVGEQFYDNDPHSFYLLLKKNLADWHQKNNKKISLSLLDKYDWSNMALEYDNRLKELAK